MQVCRGISRLPVEGPLNNDVLPLALQAIDLSCLIKREHIFEYFFGKCLIITCFCYNNGVVASNVICLINAK